MASYMAASHWLCAFPTEAGSSKSVKERIASAMIEVAGKPLADVHAFAVPTLRVGSLDGLMALTDELSRADAFVEGVLKKVERQVAESYNVLKLAELVRAAGASARVQPTLASVPPLGLRCAGRPLLDYVGDFKWDADSWDVKDPLPDLLKRMLTAAEKVDADIRSATTAYQEKRTAMLTAERKRSGNLMSAPLEDIVTPRALQDAGVEWVSEDSEFLASVLVVVGKAQEETFLASYELLDASAVPVGQEGRRDASKSSPVVPRSASKITEDKDGFALYALTVLKPFLDSFRTAAREKRYTVREFKYVPGLAGSAAKVGAALSSECDAALGALKDLSRRRYEESVSLWLHVKAMRVFVDAALRYGVPVSFTAVLLRWRVKGDSKKGLAALESAWRYIAGSRAAFDVMYAPAPLEPLDEDDDQAVGPDPLIPGVTDASGGPSVPYVFHELDLRVDTSAQVQK